MSTWIFNDDLPVWQKARERKEKEAKELAEKNAKEEELSILKYQAKCDAEEWCREHNVSTNRIRETEKGYKVTMEFNY